MFVYLACPIDLRTEPSEKLEAIVKHLEESYNVFFPARAFKYNHPNIDDANYIRRVNEQALMASDVVVAVYEGSPTVGLWTELDLCHRIRKPVIAVTEPSMVLKSVYATTLLGAHGHQTVRMSTPIPAILDALNYYLKQVKNPFLEKKGVEVVEDDGGTD